MNFPALWQNRLRAPAQTISRVVLAVIGGYFLSATLVSLAALGLSMLGMARSEAVISSAMLGFLVYLVIVLWGFAERRFRRIVLVLLLAPIALQTTINMLIDTLKVSL